MGKYKYRKYFVWVPFYLEKPYVREFYTLTLDEIGEKIDLEKLKTLNKANIEILREIRENCYPSYINLHKNSWWIKLSEEIKYKILYLSLDDLKAKANKNGTDFYKVYYMDQGKSYTMDFLEYIKMKNKKAQKGKSIRRQIKEKEEKRKKELEKKLISELFLRGEI